MRKGIFLLLFSILALTGCEINKNFYPVTFKKISYEVELNSNAFQIAKDIFTNSGDRLPGSIGGQLAEEIVYLLMRTIGCNDVHFQKVFFDDWSSSEHSLAIGKSSSRCDSIVECSIHTYSASGDVTGEIVPFNSIDPDSLLIMDLTDKIVLLPLEHHSDTIQFKSLPYVVAGYIPTLQTKYKEEVVPALIKQFGYKSIMQVPRLEKIVVNQGVGDAASGDKKLVEVAQAELSTITGQKAVQTVSRKDISNFKLRKGMPIGVKVTLRKAKMYEFLDRLVSIALPRIRDFKGIEEKMDSKGNYTLGLKEQIIFPEIDIDKITRIFGMEITFVTTATTDEEGFALLREFGLPFKNNKKLQ